MTSVKSINTVRPVQTLTVLCHSSVRTRTRDALRTSERQLGRKQNLMTRGGSGGIGVPNHYSVNWCSVENGFLGNVKSGDSEYCREIGQAMSRNELITQSDNTVIKNTLRNGK